MRVVIQRVAWAEVMISGQVTARISEGLLILLGIEGADTVEDIDYLAPKIEKLRIFSDNQGAMNLCMNEVGAQVMIASQFTLYAQTNRGNRPSFVRAAKSQPARELYEEFLSRFDDAKHGEFGADMQISLCNDGPVTIIIDSKNRE